MGIAALLTVLFAGVECVREREPSRPESFAAALSSGVSVYAFVLAVEMFVASITESPSDAARFLRLFACAAAVVSALAAMPLGLRFLRGSRKPDSGTVWSLAAFALMDAAVLWYLYATGQNFGWT